jgi:glycosyltransferase involved in cell wall biosynthesis
MTASRSVLLCTEGTYPYAGGGVSVWCDILCTTLSDVRFEVLALTGSPQPAMRYELPPNVTAVHQVPLFGTVEVTEHTRPAEAFSATFRRRGDTTEEIVEEWFVPLLRQLLWAMRTERTAAGRVFHALWRYFDRYDYSASWKAEATWQAFAAEATAPYADRPDDHDAPTLFDLTTCLRWLHAFLTPLAVPIPHTDIVHATLAGFPGLPGVIAFHERGTPLLVTDHGVFLRERYIAVSSADMSPFCKRFLLELSALVSRTVYRTAALVSPVADYNRRWELRHGVQPTRVRTVHNGIDPGVFVPGPKPANRSRPTVVAAARIMPLKDIENLVRATAVLKELVPDAHVLVYGNDDVDLPYTERCRALAAELGLEGTFELGGPHARPAELYLDGDISVLSSISEGFPYTVIESMSCGRPVVATDVGGVREALEGCGIVVPPRDPEALGRGMAELLLDRELRASLGRRAREEVLLRFRTTTSTDAYREIYDQLAVPA